MDEKKGTTLRILLAAVVALSFVSRASAGEEDKAKFFSRMATGECWGKCATLSSMEACITCGVASGRSEKGVLLYCHKLQPKCGRLAGGLKPAGAGRKSVCKLVSIQDPQTWGKSSNTSARMYSLTSRSQFARRLRFVLGPEWE
jgi:hypothetical protein